MLVSTNVHATETEPLTVEVRSGAVATWISIGPVSFFVPDLQAVRTFAAELVQAAADAHASDVLG